MNDLISRKWLMECVEEGWIKFDTEKDENRFIHLVRDTAPSAQPELQWIPCNERLPKDDTLMLVNYIDERPDAMDIWIGWHEMENVWYTNGEAHSREFGNEVVAWMPLPKPWKGEQDG